MATPQGWFCNDDNAKRYLTIQAPWMSGCCSLASIPLKVVKVICKWSQSQPQF